MTKRTVRPAWAARRSRAHVSRSSVRLISSAETFIGGARLEHATAMQRDDAGSEIEPVDALESGLFHHRLQRGLVGMNADRFGEIAIARVVAGDRLSQARQDVEAVPVVRGSQGRPYLAELEDQRDAARPEHAAHLRQRDFLVGDVAQTEADAHAVEMP